MDESPGVVASAFEVVDIAEVAALPDRGAAVFTVGERAYADDKSDPERRLAARLAAKKAARSLLGQELSDFEVVRGRGGPPALRLSGRAEAALAARGATRVLVSLTHGREQAAAAVLLVRGPA